VSPIRAADPGEASLAQLHRADECASFLGSALGEMRSPRVGHRGRQMPASSFVADRIGNNHVPDFAFVAEIFGDALRLVRPGDDPRASARAGQTRRHSKTSPLVMLKASLAATAECAAHTTTSATRPASARRLQAWVRFGYSFCSALQSRSRSRRARCSCCRSTGRSQRQWACR
jgi:hypothetical protein